MGERKEYIRREDLTPEYLEGIREESNIPHREVLDFVVRRPHDQNPAMPKGAIMRKVALIKHDKRANIVGFASRSIRVRADQYRETLVEPFHIKNKYMFRVGDPEYQLADDNTPELDEEGAVTATDHLERMRMNLMVEACVSMVNEKMFVYQDGETVDDSEFVLKISYEQDITDLTDVGGHPNSGGDFSDPATCKCLYESRLIKSGYRDAAGIDFTPNLMFINPNTAAVMLSQPDILAKYKPLQSSDPDNIGETYDGFTYDGITYITWHKDYMTADGLKAPVKDGYGIVTVAVDPATGEPPIEWHSAGNILNRGDATIARYDGLTEGEEEPEIGVKVYDNGIPAPSRRFIIRHVKLFTP